MNPLNDKNNDMLHILMSHFKSEALFFQTFIDTLPMPVFYKDKDLRYIGCNKSFEAFYGLCRSDVIGKTVFDISSGITAETFHQKDLELLNLGLNQVYELPLVNKADESKYVRFNKAVLIDSENTPIGIVGVIEDLTLIKKAETQLLLSKQKFMTLVENALTVILQMDIYGSILYMNEYAETLFELHSNEMIGENFFSILMPGVSHNFNHGSTILQQETENILDFLKSSFTNSFVTKSQKTLWISWKSKPIYNDQNKIVGLISIGHDITEQVNLELKLIQSTQIAEEANRLKGQFIANMSDEIRNPLNAILGFAELLNLQEDQPEKKEMLYHIANAGKSLLNIVTEILDFSALQSEQITIANNVFEISDIAGQCSNVRDPLLSKNLQLIFECDPCLPTVLGDELRLSQVLVKLLENAIKYTHSGHVKIKIVKTNEDIDNITVCFFISDTGVGISQSDQPKIFEEFYQVESSPKMNTHGVGLGLSIVKQLVQLMQGVIKLDSSLGQGTTIIVSIPFNKYLKNETLKTIHHGTFETDTTYLQVLVIEDIPYNQNILKKVIQVKGHHVDIVSCASDGILLAEKNKYHIIFINIDLPDMNGYKATELLRNKGFTNKIIATTVFPEDMDSQKSINAGIDNFITKPFRFNDIYHALS